MCRIVHLLLICSFLWVFINSTIADSYNYQLPRFVENCEPNEFQCAKTKLCIKGNLRCNGEYDCEHDDGYESGDISDEADCPAHSHFKCADYEFQCDNKECISKEDFCNGKLNCIDESDEPSDCQKHLNCTGQFQCENGYCTRKEFQCDSINDCTDGSDEINCENERFLDADDRCHNNANNRYKCNNTRCISLDVVCNSKDDCGDWSDEHFQCDNTSLCSSVKCQYCKPTPAGPVCFCPSGYKLQNNTCIDIDECQTYGICDQGCKNLPGSYNCFCNPDYSLQGDKKTCKANGGEATLFFSTANHIYGYHLDSQMIYNEVNENLERPFYIVTNKDYLYWFEVYSRIPMIKRFDTRTHEQQETIVTIGLSRNVKDLDVDWITGNIYFADFSYQRIGVCNDKGTNCTILITDVDPLSFALLPAKGLMYYYDDRTKEIQMAGMDGNNVTTVIKLATTIGGIRYNIFPVIKLAIDYPNNRLYWLEHNIFHSFRIKSIKLDGTDERTVFSPLTSDKFLHGRPNSLVVFENKLYWDNSESSTIETCDKFFGRNLTVLLHLEDEVPYSLYIDHSAMKTSNVPNPCHTNPCEQLCLLNRNKSHTCRCSMGQELNPDQRTCREVKKKQHIIVIAGNKIAKYDHKLIGMPIVTTSSFQHSITAAVYDQLTGSILAIDQQSHQIFRYHPESNEYENLISIEDMIVGGLAFDYIGNNVYLSNLERKSIEVYSLTTKEKTIFYFEEEPHYIETVPKEGIMYVMFQVDDLETRLDKMQMNGLGERIPMRVIKEAEQSRLLMYYDSYEDLLYTNMDQYDWRDIKAEYSGVGLTKRDFNLKSASEYAVRFVVTEDSIFWTQRSSDVLFGVDKRSKYIDWGSFDYAADMPVDRVEIPFVIHLRGKIAVKKKGCQQNNGNCSHVCLPSSPQLFICACPPGYALSANNRTCTVLSACPIDEIKCSEHDICIKKTQWCDGHPDCPNGEDEENNCKLQRDICKENCTEQCTKNQFKCHDGKCISRYLVCDNHQDCPDFSDELYCSNRTCALDEFMCDTGKCIPKEFRCDGENDCPDNSDERGNCPSHVCDSDYYHCDNNRCISALLRCNGLNDCGDHSDEKHCKKPDNSHNCTENQYPCKSSDKCVSKEARCDGKQDCPKNDDEDCLHCWDDEFRCYDQSKCILNIFRCDETADCDDKSDEINCNGDKTKHIEHCDFNCTNGTCLSFKNVCNKIRDCSDGSDEINNCSTFCENAKCTHLCRPAPHGAICDCLPGFSLDSDKVSCNDINECEQNVCSQTCVNTVGSFECRCLDGYVLRTDKISCKAIGPQERFITTTDEDIRNVSSDLYIFEVVHQLVAPGINSIDSNALDDAFYWSSVEAGTLNKMNVKTQEIFTMGNLTPKAIAVDWITNNVYFNDDIHPNVIKVCNLEQRKCAVVKKIIKTATVTALAVDPINRYLFWSQFIWQGKPTAEIYRSNLIGADIKKIVFGNISSISGMAIDYPRSKLYWSDSHLNIIESINLDGNKRDTFLHTKDYPPMGIDIFEDSLYWLMGSSGKLRKCILYGNKTCTTINIGVHHLHNYFTIFHVAKRPMVENLCKKQHCDYMCALMSNNRTACICQDGKPVESGTICPTNANKEITFMKYSKEKATPIRYEGGIYGTVIVVILVVAAMLSVYYFYQKYRFRFSALDRNSFDSIRFQNPSFDRRDEVAVTLNASTSSNIYPGQHEYTNPVDEKLFEAAQESSLKRLKESSKESTNLEKKSRSNSGTERNTSLINLHI